MPPVQAAGPLHRVPGRRRLPRVGLAAGRPCRSGGSLRRAGTGRPDRRTRPARRRVLRGLPRPGDLPGALLSPGRLRPARTARRAGTVHHARRADRDRLHDLQRALRPCAPVLYHRPSIRRAGWLEHRHHALRRGSGKLRAHCAPVSRGPLRPGRGIRRGRLAVVGKLGRGRGGGRPGSRHMGRYGPDQADRLSRPLLRGQRRADAAAVAAGTARVRPGGFVGTRHRVGGEDRRPGLHRAARRTVRAEFP